MKKILASVLALCIALTMVSITSFATETEDVILVSENIGIEETQTEETQEAVEEAVEETVEETVEEAVEETGAELFEEVTEPVGAPVAKVGNTEYTSIDEAVAAWTNGATLTLLADVTLSDVVKIKSTEARTLELGTYTMTAASGKHAIEITCEGRSNASYALTINADAYNPGGIIATGKSCIYYKKSGSTKDRPIILINGGEFTGSYALNITSNGNTNCPQIWICGGIFNSYINLTKCMLRIFGGVFHGAINCTGDSSAYREFSGGTFKSWQFMTADAANKFWVGTSSANYNKGVYVDDNGYLVVSGAPIEEAGETFEACANYSSWNSYLKYSSAATYGLYYTSAEVAISKANEVKLFTVYDKDIDVNKNLTLDLTDEDANCKGNINLNGTYALNVKFNKDGFKNLKINKDANYSVLDVTAKDNGDGTVTYTYTNKNVTEEAAVAKLIDGDSVENHLSVYSAFYAADGTIGKTVKLVKDATSETLITNGKAVNDDGISVVTLDLNGKKFGLSSGGTANQADFTLFVTDESDAKTGEVAGDISRVLKTEINGTNDYSGKFTIKTNAGVWAADPSDYCVEGFAAYKQDNGTYKVDVAKSAETVITPDASTGVIESFEESVKVYTRDEETNEVKSFEVKVSSDKPEFEAEDESVPTEVKLNVSYIGKDEAVESENNYVDTHKFDISFTNEEGEEVNFKGDAEVVIEYETDKPDYYMVFYKDDEGNLTNMNATYDTSRKAFVFSTNHFSEYMVADVQSAYALGITASLEKVTETQYNVVLTGDNDTIINKFRSAQLQIDFANLTGGLSHKVVEVDNIQIIRPETSGSDVYEFNVVGTDKDTEDINYITDKKIVLAKVELYNHGTGTLSLVQNAKSMVYTTRVETEAVEKIIVPTAAQTQNIDIKPEEVSLTIDVEFDKNTVSESDVNYQQMTVRIYGGDITEDTADDYIFQLGTGGITQVNNVYTIEKNLRKGLIYNVEISGAGYRTYDHQVIMADDKEITFWGNLKGGSADPKKPVDRMYDGSADYDTHSVEWTFLEGDVVMDYTVDIYDLSAVVSYFNRAFTKADTQYAAYDLNRDGRIDAVDIGRVLNSWGK